ncbi:MAG: extracellular solute-binding protein [Lachnospiraceae bacterium]|nr:extracellular solute-binding protein [Lachnospiraceae bacterium]
MHIRQKKHFFNRRNNTLSRHVIRWAALFPALFLALSLTGCALGDSGDENDSPYVFETQFYSPAGGVEDFTVFENSVYYSTFDGEFYRWTPGEEAQKLDIEPFLSEVGNPADSRTLQADPQGNLYVFYRVKDSQSASSAEYLVKYDAAGKELARESVTLLTRQFIPGETMVDAEGRLYLRGMNNILLFDGLCGYLGEAKCAEEENPEWLAGDTEGHVYCSVRNFRTDQEFIREVVYGEGDAPITFSGDISDRFQGGNYLAAYGENGFLTSMDNSLYLYDTAADTQTILLQWANCDIDPDTVRRVTTLANGRILVYLQETTDTGELALLTEIPREQAAQKETITLGILEAGNSHLLRCVSRFNRNSPDYRIEIREYYDVLLDSDQPEAVEEARTALHLDIVSGRCPDILVLEYDDLETYASKGLLEDLAPYLEANDQLELSDNVLDSYTFDGKLCALPGALKIRTIIGRLGDLGQLGEQEGWTLEEMVDFMDSHPDQTVFSADAGELLAYCLTFNQSRFVDQESHTCDFTSDAFISLLEFCGRFAGKQADEGKAVLNLMGREDGALLHEVELVRPEDIALLMQILPVAKLNAISCLGFPALDGQTGCLLEDCGGTCAISAKSEYKEEAWTFLEMLLTGWDSPPETFSALLYTQGFPTELNTREQYFAKVTEDPYLLQENGEILMKYGEPARAFGHSLVQNGVRVYFYVPLPEETDLICRLLDSATTVRGGRQILSIVSQEAPAYFNGQKSAADVAAIIQNRVSVYLEEQE